MRSTVIVSHGSPSRHEPQEAVMHALAEAVRAHLPGWPVRGATLAAPGALEAVLAETLKEDGAPLVYPFFIADGWFVNTNLPARLEKAGAPRTRRLPPFGTDPGLVALMLQAAEAGASAMNRRPDELTLLLAAHGSRCHCDTADTTKHAMHALRAAGRFKAVTAGFIEEPPYLAEAARGLGQGLCLPFFCLSAGHVSTDVPEALAQAGFEGSVLPPVGEHPGVPELIAAALARAGVEVSA